MPGLKWQKSEVQSLKKQFKNLGLLEEISLVGRNINSIRAKASRLGLIGGQSRRPWTKRQENLLREYVKEGWTALEIVSSIAYIGALTPLACFSQNAIQKKIQRLGLANKVRSRRAKKVKQFSQEEKIEFRKFLVANYSCMTPEQLAKEWNKSHETKVKRSRVLHHLLVIDRKLPREIIIQMPYSRAKRRRSRKRQKSLHPPSEL